MPNDEVAQRSDVRVRAWILWPATSPFRIICLAFAAAGSYIPLTPRRAAASIWRHFHPSRGNFRKSASSSPSRQKHSKLRVRATVGTTGLPSETPVQWGRMDYVQYQAYAADPSSRAVGAGPTYFIVTSYPFPAVIDTYSHGYLIYLYFASSPSISWHQAPLAINNPGSTATVASAVITLGTSPSSCVVQNEWHK